MLVNFCLNISDVLFPYTVYLLDNKGFIKNRFQVYFMGKHILCL